MKLRKLILSSFLVAALPLWAKSESKKAPLLLGQPVLERLGKIEIDNHGMKLVITHKVTK